MSPNHGEHRRRRASIAYETFYNKQSPREQQRRPSKFDDLTWEEQKQWAAMYEDFHEEGNFLGKQIRLQNCSSADIETSQMKSSMSRCRLPYALHLALSLEG